MGASIRSPRTLRLAPLPLLAALLLPSPAARALTVRWLGQSAFLWTTRSGVKILNDPYEPGAFHGAMRYKKISAAPDVVLVSHGHPDHDWVQPFLRSAVVLKEPGAKEVKGIPFLGIASVHDKNGGKDRGPNVIFCFTADGLRVCHLGDQGALLTAAQQGAMGKVDILVVPTGGYYTVDPAEATEIVEEVKPRIVLPMHYLTGGLDPGFFPLVGVGAFTHGKKRVREFADRQVDFSKETLHKRTEIWVLRANNLP